MMEGQDGEEDYNQISGDFFPFSKNEELSF